jgi:hypothetical protein
MMTSEQEAHEIEPSAPAEAEVATDNPKVESEFKLTVRRLELPVKPRGVLAE